MEMRVLGNSGLRVSRLALGTMTWGRDTDEHEAAEQLKAYLDSGGNFIDTAASYGDGDSERVIGGFLETLVPRDELILASKAGISWTSGERIIKDRKSTRLNSSHSQQSRMPSSA